MTEDDNKSSTEEHAGPVSPWSPPEGAATFKLERRTADGSWEVCEYYDPATRSWSQRIPLPYGAEDILSTWGSGYYQVQYFSAVGRSKGRPNKAVHLDAAEYPPMPRQYRVPDGPERPTAPTTAPVAQPRSPFHALPSQMPQLPAELGANEAVRQMLYWKSFADAEADRRVVREEEHFARALQRQQLQHRNNMDEMAARHRRDMEHMEGLMRSSDPNRRVAALERAIEELDDGRGASSTAGEIVGAMKEILPLVAAYLQQQQQQKKADG